MKSLLLRHVVCAILFSQLSLTARTMRETSLDLGSDIGAVEHSEQHKDSIREEANATGGIFPTTVNRFCIRCKGGRHIYVRRSQNMWQSAGKALDTYAAKAAFKATMYVIPHTAPFMAAADALTVANNMRSWFETYQDVMAAIKEKARSTVGFVEIAWRDNGPKLGERTTRYQPEDVGYLELKDEDGENENLEALRLFFKNYQTVWAYEKHCKAWNSCYPSIPFRHPPVSPLMEQLIDENPWLCGAPGQDGARNHETEPTIMWSDGGQSFPDNEEFQCLTSQCPSVSC